MISAAPQPDHTLVVLTGVVAVAAVFVNPLWAVSGHLYTAAHEGGHALTALVVGRRLTGIRMHADRSGATHSAGPDRGAGLVVTAAAGYLMPSLIGLAGAALLDSGHDPRGLLLVGVLALTGMFLMIRNVVGGLVLLLFGGLLVLASYRADAQMQAAAAYTLTWFLLFSGVRGAFELFRGFSQDSDPAHLSRMTFLPAVIWVLLFAAASGAALLIGGRWMLT
jgi:hypothetical protein